MSFIHLTDITGDPLSDSRTVKRFFTGGCSLKGTVPYNDSSVSTSDIQPKEVNVEGSQQAAVAGNSKAYTSAACLGLAIASGMLFPDQGRATTEPSVAPVTPVTHPSTNAGDSEPWQPSLLRTVSEMNQSPDLLNQPVVKQQPADKAFEEHLAGSEFIPESPDPVVPSKLFPPSSIQNQNRFQPHSVPTESASIYPSQPSSVEFPSYSSYSSAEPAYPSSQTVYTQPKMGGQPKFSETLKTPGALVIEPDLTDHSVSVVYNVTPGDTLAQIAAHHHVPIKTLIETNHLSDPNHIEVNQRLKIPQKPTLNQGSKFDPTQASADFPTPLGRRSLFSSPLSPTNPSRSLFHPAVIPSVIPAEVKAPMVAKPLSVPLGTSVLSQMAAAAGDQGPMALTQLTLDQTEKKSSVPKPINPTLLSTPLISDDRSIDLPQTPTAQLHLKNPQQSNSNEHSTQQRHHSTKVYTNRLRAEVDRLRTEYQTQQNYQFVNASWEPESEQQQPESTPTMVQLADRLRRVNPEFNPQMDMEVDSPPQDALAQQVQPIDPQPTSGRLVDQLREGSEADDVVATAPLGSSAYDPLKNPAIGRIVSPELPPLPGPDVYLPGGSMQFQGYIWPSQGILTSGYGWRWGRMHRGIDIAAPIGTPIFAAAPGVVAYAGWNSGGYGNLVEIEHPDGSVTLYAHNSQILVNKGQKVSQGQQISTMGSTGRSTGPHLHFEIHPSGNGAVNPMALLPQERSNVSRY